MILADGTIKYGVELDSSGAVKGLQDIEKEAGKTANNASKSIDKIATAFLAAEAAVAGMIVKSGLDFNSQLEGYQTSFEVMTGSAEEAYSIVDRLKTQAAQTPFDLTQLAKTTQLMMNYGMAGDEALGMMTRLGDIAQGDAQKLDSVSLAFSQMSSLGKVQLQDIKQMINGGFNPLQEIAERTGESMESLYDRISKGTLSVNEINESIIRATSVGGKYFNSMDKQSQTLKGRWNTLKDTVREATGNMTKGLADTLASDILPKATEAVKWLGENFEKLIPLVITLTAAFATLKVAMSVDDIVKGWNKLTDAIELLVASGAGAIAILAALYAACVVMAIQANQSSDEFNAWHQKIEDVNKATDNLHTNMAGLPDLMSGLGNNIETTAQQADGYLSVLEELEGKGELNAQEQETWNNTLAALQGIMPGITELIDEETGAIDGGTAALRDYVEAWKQKQYQEALSEVTTEAIKTEMEAIENLATATANYEALLAEQNTNYQQEAVLLEQANQLMGTQYDSLSAAADALQAYAESADVDKVALTDLANQMIGLNTNIEEHDKLLGESKAAVDEAAAARDKAGKVVKAYSDAEAAAMNGTKTFTEAYTDCMNEVNSATNDTVDNMTDGTNKWENMTAQWKLAAERDIDQGLVVALQRAGFDSQTQLAWMLNQSDSQLQSWNEVFRQDSKAAVDQITKAFKESGVPDEASAMARRAENNFKPDLYGSGVNAVAGAISGMEAKREALRSKAASLASSVRSAFNVRLDVKSPSRVMMESGRYVVEGVMVGMENERYELAKEATKMADVISGSFHPHIDTSGIESVGEIQSIQQTEMVSQMAAQVSSAPIEVHMDIDGREFASATALPMSYALETLRVAEARG